MRMDDGMDGRMDDETEDGVPVHDPGWEYPYPEVQDGWPDDDDGPLVWVNHSIRRIANELTCVIHHLDRGLVDEREQVSDWFNAAMHMSNIMEGIGSVTHTLFSELLSDEDRVGVTLHLAQLRLGIPLIAKRVDGANGQSYIVVEPDRSVDAEGLPDTLEEMMRGEAGGGGGGNV